MRDRSVWIGCRGALTRFVPATGEVRRWTQDDATDPAPLGIIQQLAELPDGSVWLGADDAIQLRARDGRILERIVAGEMIERNPGVVCLWFTTSFRATSS